MTRTEAILAELQDRTCSDAEIARRHGVTRERVSQIRRRAGIPPLTPPRKPPAEPSRVFWTDDELAYLITHADDPVAEVAAALGRGVPATYNMRERLAKQGRIPKRRVPMTERELTLLKDPHLTHAEVAQRTGRSRRVIAQSRRRRGIRIGHR
jgi:transcriptional regulator with XRE-family HTH domain